MRLHPLRSAAPALFLLLSASAFAGDKTVMHCFAWTPIKEATQADWDAFYKASDALPQKIKGIIRVWYGKLQSPLGQTMITQDLDQATVQKYRGGQPITTTVQRAPREYGMCMEMKDAAVLKAYDTDPYHKTWTDAYAKIRVDGTTTFNILGQ